VLFFIVSRKYSNNHREIVYRISSDGFTWEPEIVVHSAVMDNHTPILLTFTNRTDIVWRPIDSDYAVNNMLTIA
jgi:hypothetical protein